MNRFLPLFFLFIIIFSLYPQNKEERITVSFEDLPVREVVNALNQKYGLNIVIQKDVKGDVTLYLKDVTVEQLLNTLARSIGCYLNIEDNVYYLTRGRPVKLSVSIKNGLMTLDCEDIEITQVLREISKKSGLTIITEERVKGMKVSGYMESIPLKKGLKSFLTSKGFQMIEEEEIIKVSRIEDTREARKRAFYLTVKEDSLISMDIRDVELESFLEELSREMGLDIITYGDLPGKVNATVENQPLEKTLELVLSGTKYGYKKIEDIFVVGSTEGKAPGASAISSISLIPFKYSMAEEAVKLLPSTIPSENIKVVNEHNAFLFSGTNEQEEHLKEFINVIDVPPKRIKIRAIILTVSRQKLLEFGVRAGYGIGDDEATILPELHRTYGKKEIDEILEFISSSLNLGTTIEVPSNFNLVFSALEQEGIAKVHAEPSVVTLSGHKANINVGWVGYYRTRLGDPENPIIQIHSVSAGVNLRITPWIGEENDVTVNTEIEVSSLRGISAAGLPEISKRSVETTLKLMEGETAIIGGLIQKVESVTKDKVPILGDIPLIGEFLFSSESINRDESELIIYLTPEIIPWKE